MASLKNVMSTTWISVLQRRIKGTRAAQGTPPLNVYPWYILSIEHTLGVSWAALRPQSSDPMLACECQTSEYKFNAMGFLVLKSANLPRWDLHSVHISVIHFKAINEIQNKASSRPPSYFKWGKILSLTEKVSQMQHRHHMQCQLCDDPTQNQQLAARTQPSSK